MLLGAVLCCSALFMVRTQPPPAVVETPKTPKVAPLNSHLGVAPVAGVGGAQEHVAMLCVAEAATAASSLSSGVKWQGPV